MPGSKGVNKPFYFWKHIFDFVNFSPFGLYLRLSWVLKFQFPLVWHALSKCVNYFIFLSYSKNETLDACLIFVLFYQAFVDRHGWTSSARNKPHPNSRKVSRLGECQTSLSWTLVVHAGADLQKIALSVGASVTPCWECSKELSMHMHSCLRPFKLTS